MLFSNCCIDGASQYDDWYHKILLLALIWLS
jgi:hypothetical protein